MHTEENKYIIAKTREYFHTDRTKSYMTVVIPTIEEQLSTKTSYEYNVVKFEEMFMPSKLLL